MALFNEIFCRNPLEKLRLSDAQKRAILACRKEVCIYEKFY